ncbi:polyisoprenoid-binding protein YceI [Acetobacter oeni]|nr:polyisoprenoid-binding protein YceI [Acetobacter oeni]
MDLSSAATGDRQRDTALPGRDWFDIARFPEATFSATSVRKTGVNTYEAIGTLSLRGIIRSVILPFTFDRNGTTAP